MLLEKRALWSGHILNQTRLHLIDITPRLRKEEARKKRAAEVKWRGPLLLFSYAIVPEFCIV